MYTKMHKSIMDGLEKKQFNRKKSMISVCVCVRVRIYCINIEDQQLHRTGKSNSSKPKKTKTIDDMIRTWKVKYRKKVQVYNKNEKQEWYGPRERPMKKNEIKWRTKAITVTTTHHFESRKVREKILNYNLVFLFEM